MSDSGLTISQLSAAGSYARADALAVAIPVRPIDPVRQRFQVRDQDGAEQTAAQSETGATASSGQGAGTSAQGQAAGGSLGGLLGAFTAFLTRVFAQAEPEATATAAAVQAGIQAYARRADAATTATAADIQMPSFPRLSSGRAVDLSV